MALACDGQTPVPRHQRSTSRGFESTLVHSPSASILIPLAILGICVAAIVVVTLTIVAIRTRRRRKILKEETASDAELLGVPTTDQLTPLSAASRVSVYPGLLISASMCYTPVNSAETNDPEHSVEEEFKPATGSTPESRVPSSLLDSSTSHMAVYDDPYGAIEHLSPPPAVRVPPMPPLPSHILEGRTLLNKYKTLRQARRARQSADHEARKPSKRYATDGGVCLSGGRTSAQTIATIGSAQSKRSEDTVQTCSTMPPPYGVYS